ncbi:MAG: hypothetical protein K0S93_169 [Nitrososphaeraceae archaeon]|jgi:hypothetical protein|nr:hypothetical protein [Nitrososphaeraceae archaeon]
MVNRDGQTRTKLPTQYKTNKSKKKILKKEGDRLNYQIIKCVVCNKKKMEKYELKDQKGEMVTINKCKNCKFTNASVVQAFTSDGSDPYVVNYFNPKALEDKS